MTQRERLVVSAYTGYLMCDFSQVHEYIEQVMGRPVWTHEMATDEFETELKKRVKPELLKLCGNSD